MMQFEKVRGRSRDIAFRIQNHAKTVEYLVDHHRDTDTNKYRDGAAMFYRYGKPKKKKLLG